MSLQKSVERLQQSRIVPDRYMFQLEDIQGVFDAYNEMTDEERKGGKLIAVLGRDKTGLADMHLVLLDADGEVCYSGNVSHPCPPFGECG